MGVSFSLLAFTFTSSIGTLSFPFFPQSSLDDVEALQKRHDDFENSLAAQDERLKSFSEAADKLIAAKHYDTKK